MGYMIIIQVCTILCSEILVDK